jgi:hypothetical protein
LRTRLEGFFCTTLFPKVRRPERLNTKTLYFHLHVLPPTLSAGIRVVCATTHGAHPTTCEPKKMRKFRFLRGANGWRLFLAWSFDAFRLLHPDERVSISWWIPLFVPRPEHWRRIDYSWQPIWISRNCDCR